VFTMPKTETSASGSPRPAAGRRVSLV